MFRRLSHSTPSSPCLMSIVWGLILDVMWPWVISTNQSSCYSVFPSGVSRMGLGLIGGNIQRSDYFKNKSSNKEGRRAVARVVNVCQKTSSQLWYLNKLWHHWWLVVSREQSPCSLKHLKRMSKIVQVDVYCSYPIKTIGTKNSHDGDGKENLGWKLHSCFFKPLCTCSNLFSLSSKIELPTEMTLYE